MRYTMLFSKKWGLSMLLLASCAVVATLLYHPQPVMGEINTPEVAQAQALSDAFATVAENVSPGVVFISVEKEMPKRTRAMNPQDLLEQFFGPFGRQMPQQRQPESSGPVPVGQGSGFLISDDGYIVTNHHVAGDADVLRVTLHDGREFEAELIGTDPHTEIALIKIDGKDLPHLKLGNSDALRVGEWVLAIGSPFGLEHTVTQGIVSARGRGNVGIVDYADFIQTDAAINPGNSGGPLVNLKGEVIGMNTAIYSRSGGYMGIGFAIPASMIQYVEGQLRDHGDVTRGFLGVNIQNLTSELSQWFGIKDGKGVLIAGVAEDGPAEDAGLKRDDIVLEFDGKPVEEIGSFRSRVASTAPGTKVELRILRDGKELTKTVKIGTLPEDDEGIIRTGKTRTHQDLGISVQNLTDELAERFGVEGEEGVIVAQVDPGSAADRAGLEEGMLIQEVNRIKIHNTDDFQSAMKKQKDNQGVLLLVREGRYTRYVVIEMK